MGAKPSFPLTSSQTDAARLAHTGGNTGNQMIAHGLLAPLVYSAVDWDYARGPQYVDANFDIILIAAANFLFEGFDLGGMADFISRTRLPVVMVGVGAQSNTYSTDIKLQLGTERLMRIVAERSKLIGVRGEFTQAVLNRMGILNVQVTGCPSYYMRGTDGLLPRKPPFPDRPRIAVNGSRDVLRHAFDKDRMKQVLSNLVAQAVAHDGMFIAQTESEEFILASGRSDAEAEAALDRFADFYRHSVDTGPQFRTWARNRIRVFWSIEDWIEAMRGLDFVVGTRFHGAIAAMTAGTLSFVVCHDTRTTEMCEFLGLPHAKITAIDDVDLRKLYEEIDVDTVNARRHALLPLYKMFLDRNGLAHDLQ